MSTELLVRPEPVVVRRRRRLERGPLHPTTALTVWVLLALGSLALWAVLYPVVVGALQEQDHQQRLFGQLRRQLSQATAPLGPVSPGRPVALLDLPAAGLLGAVVVEGTAGPDLQKGPGHLRNSVLPGQAGTAVLLGRAITFGGPFGRIGSLRTGDPITVTTGQGVFRYRVTGVRRPGDPLPTPLAAGAGRLVLGTAAGSGWRSGLAPSSVVYVDAVLTGKAVVSLGGIPTAVPDSEKPMGHSGAPLLGLVFWLQAVVLAAGATVWLRSRWGHWQAWLVCCPALLALVIGASGAAAQLLPNLL